MVLKHSDKIALHVGEPAGIRKLPNNKAIHNYYTRLDMIKGLKCGSGNIDDPSQRRLH